MNTTTNSIYSTSAQYCIILAILAVTAALALAGCGGSSASSEDEPKPEAGSNKQEVVALEEGSLRDLVQEQVGDFELQEVEEIPADSREKEQGIVEFLKARYTRGPAALHWSID